MKKNLKVLLIFITSIALILTLLMLIMDREKHELTQELRQSGTYNFLKLRNGYTEYEIDGEPDGIPVILIHGLTVPMFDWDRQFDFLVSQGYRVLRYNQFGRGLSDRPFVIYNRDLYMEQLNELIDHFFKRKVNLIGHSFGGGLTAEYGARYPNKVDKLIFISPVLNVRKENGGVSLIRMPVIGDYCAKTILSPILASRASGLFSTAADEIKEDDYNREFEKQTSVKGFSYAVKSLFRNDAVGDYSDSYSKIDGMNSLLLWGELDNSVSRNDINSIKDLNSQITVKVYKNVNHSPNLEIPDEINDQILRFLDS